MNDCAVFPARYDVIASICEFVQAGAEAAGFGEDEQFRVQLACDEACTNIIEHAYGGENQGEIEVKVQATTGTLTIELHDNGQSFDPENQPELNRPLKIKTEEDLERLQAGGLGLHFMRTIMDEVRFHFDVREGNTLVMVKRKV